MRFMLFVCCLLPFVLNAQIQQNPDEKHPTSQPSTPEEQEIIMGEGPMENDPEVMKLRGDETFDESHTTENWSNHKKDEYEVAFPKEWELDVSGTMGTSFFIFSPLENDSDDFRENMNLHIQDLNGAQVTMDEFVDATDGFLAKAITDYKLDFSKRGTQNGREIQHFSYFGTQGSYNLQFEQQAYLANGKSYILTFTRKIGSPSEFQKIATEIFKSFKITDQ